MNTSLYIARKIADSTISGSSNKIIKIAIASIAITIIVIMVSYSVMLGFKNTIAEKLFGFWGHIHVTETKILRSYELAPFPMSIAMMDTISEIGQVSYVEYGTDGPPEVTEGGIRNISTFINFPGIVNTKNELEGLVLKGVDHNYDRETLNIYLQEGRFPAYSDTITSREVMVSHTTANRLSLKVGDKMIIQFPNDKEIIRKPVKVVGLYKTGIEEYDKRFAYVDISLIREVLDWESNMITGYEILVDHVDDAPIITDYIYSELLPRNLYAESTHERQKEDFEWLEMQELNELIIIILMILVALINMSTAILILIVDRSRMIGILKTLGQSNWNIRKTFLYIAFRILGYALVIGNVIGLVFMFLQSQYGFLKLDEKNYYLSEVPIAFDFSAILLLNIGVVFVTMMAMILPTILVSTMTPLKILRFE